jgi:trimeric autotransporter adhesin
MIRLLVWGSRVLEVLVMNSLAKICISFLLFALLGLTGFAQSGVITTYAGPGSPVGGSSASGQPIGSPSGLASDRAGGFYVAVGGQNVVYRVTSDGKINVAAGNGTPGFSGDGGAATSACLSYPTGLLVDSSGNLFIADSNNNRIRKVTSSGIISTFAGNGDADYSGDGDRAISAALNFPMGLAFDLSGNLLIADSANHRIRKVSNTGVIITIAGNGSGAFSGDEDLATSAALDRPTALAVDESGNLYIADSANQRVRKLTTDGDIDTIAGDGTAGYSGDGGQATETPLNNPVALAVDYSGTLYIADSFNFRIRKLSGGTITTFAGNGKAGFSGDNGPAASAQIYMPRALAIDTSGNLLIADYANRRVRKVTSSGTISTVAGIGGEGFSGDGAQAASALLRLPSAVAVDSTGNLFIADSANYRVRKISVGGVISTLAGTGTQGYSGDGAQAAAATFDGPVGVAVDASGNLYIADYADQRVRKVSSGGTISTLAGTGTQGYSGDGGQATSAQLNQPWGLAADASGTVYIADLMNHSIRKVTPGGVITTVAGTGRPGFAGDGGQAALAQLRYPAGVAVDKSGNLFIADTGNSRVRKVSSAGIITTVAGIMIAGYSGDGGSASSAQLNGPTAVAVDAAGNLYICDHGNNRIRKVASDGVITTIAGVGSPGFSGDGGQAASAQLNGPMGIALDSAGNVFIADYDNSRIRKVTSKTAASSYFPQVAVGNGYSTLFTLSNRGPAKASGILRLMDSAGNPLSATGTLTDSAGETASSSLGSEFALSVPAGETVFFAAAGATAESPVQVGWGQLESTAGVLTGNATYEYFSGSTLCASVDTLQSPLLQSATVAVENDGSRRKQLAYAIANPGNEDIAVTLTLVDPNGAVAGAPATLKLGPKQQIANYLWQDLPCADFKGSLHLQGQAGAAFIAVALLDNQGFLTAIPLTSGAVD